jgi:hypothetical protein
MPMLAALVGGAAGSAASNVMMGSTMMASASHPVEAGWLVLLGRLSWPLLLVSVGLIIWSFRRTAPLPRALAYLSVALLVVNRLDMSLWWFVPAMAVLAAAFVVSALGQRGLKPMAAVPVRPRAD